MTSANGNPQINEILAGNDTSRVFMNGAVPFTASTTCQIHQMIGRICSFRLFRTHFIAPVGMLRQYFVHLTLIHQSS
jgi:hypothetical protein